MPLGSMPTAQNCGDIFGKTAQHRRPVLQMHGVVSVAVCLAIHPSAGAVWVV